MSTFSTLVHCKHPAAQNCQYSCHGSRWFFIAEMTGDYGPLLGCFPPKPPIFDLEGFFTLNSIQLISAYITAQVPYTGCKISVGKYELQFL